MVQLASSTFETNEPLLAELLGDIHKGLIQLPDFQRGWVWDDAHIRSLLASLSLAYPIGAVMLLETGGDGVRFKPRLVEGVDIAEPPMPEKLILDGQQRLTSLYMSMLSGRPVPTKNDKGDQLIRWYYFDVKKCLDPDADRQDAILGVPEDRVIRSDFGRKVDLDLSSREKEYAAGMVPMSLILDHVGFQNWRNEFQAYFDYQKDKIQFIAAFEREIWQKFQQYKLPVIELLRSTQKEAVCQVFEKVNTGGVTLSVFELVTATFAADDFSLRDDWTARDKRLHKEDLPVLEDIDATVFLTSVTLLGSYRRYLSAPADQKPAVSCKRKDVLRLTLPEYKELADLIEKGFVKAAKLLLKEKVFDLRSLPYSTQLIPLAATCAFLCDRFEQDSVKQKLARWYWCGVFGELYGGANETRFGLDLPDLVKWIDGGSDPRTISDANFSPTRLLSLQTRGSAAYKGLTALLIQQGSRDFRNGDPIELTNYFDEAVDIHHVFPDDYCTKIGLPREKWNSVVNKAPLTASTNRALGGHAPSVYIKSIVQKQSITDARFDECVRSHCIDPALLRGDDFEGFFRKRAIALLGLIENATGKGVSGRDAEETVKAFGYTLVQ